jgi:hypothetical protein
MVYILFCHVQEKFLGQYSTDNQLIRRDTNYYTTAEAGADISAAWQQW